MNAEGSKTEVEESETPKDTEEQGQEEAENPEQVIESLREENLSNYDKYLRAAAELENFKKRAFKERSELIRYAGEHLAKDLLEVVDSLEMATKVKEEQSTADLLAGVELILQSFKNVLENHSIRAEESLGQVFDPSRHEALATKPTAEAEPNSIVEEFKKAYFFKEKLLRPAQVVVAEKVQEESSEESAEETPSTE